MISRTPTGLSMFITVWTTESFSRNQSLKEGTVESCIQSFKSYSTGEFFLATNSSVYSSVHKMNNFNTPCNIYKNYHHFAWWAFISPKRIFPYTLQNNVSEPHYYHTARISGHLQTPFNKHGYVSQVCIESYSSTLYCHTNVRINVRSNIRLGGYSPHICKEILRLPRSKRIRHVKLRSSYRRGLNSYLSQINWEISDVYL